MRALTAAVLLVSSAALSAQSTSQEPPRRAPTGDRASATAVVIDVVVRDGRGRPVVNLGADDFELYEDGVRQPLGSFRAPAAAAEPPAAAPPASAAPRASASPGIVPPREPAVMAFLFDRLTLEGRKLALDAVRKYVGGQPQTPNIIGVFDVDLGLQALLPFTQDGEAIRTALKKVTAARPGRVDPQFVTELRGPTEMGIVGGKPGTTNDLTMTLAVGGAFAELQRDSGGMVSIGAAAAIVAGLSRAPGRKSLVLFTEGVALTRNTDPMFYALIDQANRANVAIYAIDSAGLRAADHNLMAGRVAAAVTTDAGGNLQVPGVDLNDVARSAPEIGLGLLANQTGGQLFAGTNDLFKVFPRLDEDLRSYYSLTYAAPRAEPDRTFHKIEVKVKRPGLSAQTRSGYTSLPAAVGGMPVLAYEAPALARLESTPVPDELPILARAFVFPVSHEAARVPVLVAVPANALEYARDEGAGTFSAEAVVLVRVRDGQGRVVHKASEQYTLSGRLAKIEASRAGELLFYRQPQLAPGVYTLEAIVLDSRSSKASVRVSSLEVPRVSETALRVGTPFIVRRAEPITAAERDAGNPLYFGNMLVYPNLGQPLSKATDKELAFGFTAYDGHATPVEASLELLRSGQSVANVPLALGAADQQGRIHQISKLSIETLPPGVYELRITVKTGTQQVTRGVPFAISGN